MFKTNAMLLTPPWKQAFEDGWLDKENPPEDILDEPVVPAPLSAHRLGQFVIVPIMSENSGVHTCVVSVVGFKQTMSIDVDMESPSCTALVYEEDPTHILPRGLLLEVRNESRTWLVMIS